MYDKSRIKTISLSANIEQEIAMPYSNVCIRNNTTGAVYASVSKDIEPYTDGVTTIQSGESRILRDIYNINDGIGKFYVVSNIDGKIELESANDVNFKCFSAKGGEIYDDTAIKAEIADLNTNKANKTDVYTKTETDNAITVKVAEIVADAPEDFDTLKEMSDWIASHENDASAMNSAIQTNATNISDLQTDKVGKNDFATKTTGGVVKIDSTYGIDIENGTAKTVPAYDNFLNAFTDDNHVITPYRFKKAMNLYGIDSQTQIADMQTEIDGKVDNDIFVAENLIKYPYESEQGKIGRGVTFTYDDDGAIHLVGTGTSTGDAFALASELTLSGTYTISVDNADAYIRVLGIDESGGTHLIVSVINGEPTTFTIGSENENIYPSYKVVVRVVLDKIYDSYFKPMLEIGSVAHAYQPYSLSRKAMRDDINTLMALLT